MIMFLSMDKLNVAPICCVKETKIVNCVYTRNSVLSRAGTGVFLLVGFIDREHQLCQSMTAFCEWSVTFR